MAEDETSPEPEMQGWLNKWTNYLLGSQKRWFTVRHGFLYYSKKPGEACRGFIRLRDAFIYEVNSTDFNVSSGGKETYYLKASDEDECQRWVAILEMAKLRAIVDSDNSDSEDCELSTDDNSSFPFLHMLTQISYMETIVNAVNKIQAMHELAISFTNLNIKAEEENLDSPVASSIFSTGNSPSTSPLTCAGTANTSIHAEYNRSVSLKRRRMIIPDKPNHNLNLWSILQNHVEKDLTKIPMPINFNEPLSALQRLTEQYEYSELLDKAAQCLDSCDQMTYVAAFTISSYATTSNRTGKPFNPLLGETYECDRTDDRGWRCISEQVSHHPPTLAQHCEGRGWECWQEITMSGKFRGKYLLVKPLGITHLLFPESGNHYTWRKVPTFIHNIIGGQLWMDHQGDMDIVNHNTGDKCQLKFIPYNHFSDEVPRRVTGLVIDQEAKEKFVLQGTWDNKIESSSVLGTERFVKNKPIFKTSTPKTIWCRFPGPEYEKVYNFTVLACQLNELEERVAPTDSRFRPDLRLMEEGSWEKAGLLKAQLEEKQRTLLSKRKEESERACKNGQRHEEYKPIWFRKEIDSITGNPFNIFIGDYWKCKETQNWSRCPKIYL